MCVYVSGREFGNCIRTMGVWISRAFDLNSCGQRFTFAGESNVFVCPVELSVRLIFPVENQRVTLVILELAWKGWDGSRWCLLKTHQTTATCPRHSAYITHPGGMYATHQHTHTHMPSVAFLFFYVATMAEVVNSLVSSASIFPS